MISHLRTDQIDKDSDVGVGLQPLFTAICQERPRIIEGNQPFMAYKMLDSGHNKMLTDKNKDKRNADNDVPDIEVTSFLTSSEFEQNEEANSLIEEMSWKRVSSLVIVP